MNYIFISPQFPKNFWNFCDRLKRNGVTVLGIGDTPYDELSLDLKNSLYEYYKVDSLENYDSVVKAVGFLIHKYGKIDWIESNNEHWLELDANLRTDFNIKSGFQNDVISGIKHKSQMKAYYEKANIKVARYHLCDTFENGKAFVEEVGYPVIVKPDNGVGAMNSYKISNEEELNQFYKEEKDTAYIMEEYIHGVLLSYDGIVGKDTEPIFETSHVFPEPIMNIVNEKKDLAYYSLKKINSDLLEQGRRALKVFNVRARCFHFEFFKLLKDKKGLGKKGELIGLEVNMRTPGGYTPDMMNYANDIDIYQMYADMITDKEGVIDYQRLYYCVYASRRDDHLYTYSDKEVIEKYKDALVMVERMPDMLAGAMGNNSFTARFKTLKEVRAFIKLVHQ